MNILLHASGDISLKPRVPAHVGLIIPPSPFLLDERVFPFLGVLKVASSLRAAGWPVEVLDLSGIRNYKEVAQTYVSNSPASVFGLTATTPQFPATVEIAEAIRSVRKDARLVLGGTHATLVVAGKKTERKAGRVDRAHRAWECMEPHFDTIVAGDGETTIFDATQAGAPKLIDADDRRSPYFLTSSMLDATPFPARDLIDMESYRYTIDGVSAQSLIAQLGCPYKCGFCAGRASPMLRNIRMRSDENIVEEMLLMYRTWGTRGFMFYDDELNVNPGMLELMERITRVQRDLSVEWKLRGFVKSERFTEAQAEAMYEAGFRQILVGFESGSPRILENIQKIATQADNTRCMDIARKHGLKVKALMSLGHPGESSETVDEVRRWLIDVRPSDFDATVITPYPGSPYYDQSVPLNGASTPTWVYEAKSGDRLYQEDVDYTREADYYKGDPDDGYKSHVWTDYLSGGDLVRERNELESQVRQHLGIPFNQSRATQLYEHSMGQLPSWILRSNTSVPSA